MHEVEDISFDGIAATLLLSSSTIRRTVSLYKTTGDVLPKEQCHGPKRLLSRDEEDFLMKWILDEPGIYLDELQQKLNSNGITVSLTTVFRTIQRLGFTRKRIRHIVQAQDELKRWEFMQEMSYLDSDMIIWIDETGSDQRQSIRTFSYHLRGIVPQDTVVSIRGRRLSTIAAMSCRGIEDIEIYDGSVDGETFSRFIERCIVPIMQPFNGSNPRSVLVLDNASVHHVKEVHELIIGCGAIIRYLPPYSPDFNPLEEVFAQIKRFLRRNSQVYHSTSDPRVLITSAFCSIDSDDCLNYIHHAGYGD